MNVRAHRTRWMPLTIPREGRGSSEWLAREHSQFRWMVALGFLLLLVPVAVARLCGWRWQPWVSSRSEQRSILGEAKEAAETYITFAFLGW